MSRDEALVSRIRSIVGKAGGCGCCASMEPDEATTEILDLLAVEGRLVEPPPFYIAPDADDDPAIWRESTDGPDECVGVRFMAGNAQIESPVAEWLWSVIPSREVAE